MRNPHSTLSKAFWKSIKIIRPGIFSVAVKSIISYIDLIVSPIKRSLHIQSDFDGLYQVEHFLSPMQLL